MKDFQAPDSTETGGDGTHGHTPYLTLAWADSTIFYRCTQCSAVVGETVLPLEPESTSNRDHHADWHNGLATRRETQT